MEQDNASAQRLRRTLQACRACRQRKTKCDGRRPRCRHCSSRNIPCVWPDGNVVPSSVSTDAGLASRSPQNHVLPSSEALRHCFEIFFQRHFAPDFCSFLYKKDFLEHYRDMPFLSISIVALCSRYLSPSRARQDYSLSSAEEVGNLYAKIARRMARDTSDQPTVPNIQANLVLALSELLSGSGSRQWMYAGNAIRMAQVMRLNKDFHQRHPPREQEIRRRIFWACFVFDRLLASSMAKPRTLSVGNIGIALPSTDLALAYREETRGFTLDTLNAFSGAPSEIGIMPFLLVTVSLFSDIADIHICRGRFNEKLPPTDPRSQFFQRHAAMREWAGSLPSWLRWNEHNYSVHDDLGLGKEFTAMHLLLRSSMCIAHQGYLPQNDGSSILLDTLDAAGLSLLHRDDGLISTCVSNALAVGEMVTWLAREERSADANLRSPWVAIALLSVSPSLLWLQYSDESQDHAASSGLARSFLESFNLLLQSWRSSWRVASEWLAVLDGMERLYRSAYLGEVSEGSPEGSQGEGSHADAVDEEEPGQYRPKPGDGFPHISTAAPLYTMLRLSGSGASPISPAETQQHWMWLQLIETWPHNLSEVSMQGLDDDSLRFLGMS